VDNNEDTLKAIRALVGATETEDVVSAVEKRIQELLECNNRMLERARKAEADLRQALEPKCS
jgi:hypothetical protein